MTTYSLSHTQWQRWKNGQTPVIVHFPHKLAGSSSTACNQKAYYILAVTKQMADEGFELCSRCSQIYG